MGGGVPHQPSKCVPVHSSMYMPGISGRLWAGVMPLGVNRLSVIFKATSLDEITYGVGVQSRAGTEPWKTPVVTS